MAGNVHNEENPSPEDTQCTCSSDENDSTKDQDDFDQDGFQEPKPEQINTTSELVA